jgi:hypothetical protein
MGTANDQQIRKYIIPRNPASRGNPIPKMRLGCFVISSITTPEAPNNAAAGIRERRKGPKASRLDTVVARKQGKKRVFTISTTS